MGAGSTQDDVVLVLPTPLITSKPIRLRLVSSKIGNNWFQSLQESALGVLLIVDAYFGRRLLTFMSIDGLRCY